MVPKNMIHLLQALELTTNASVKKMEKKCFSEYFTNVITKDMLRDPKRNVTTIAVDLRLSTLKPVHAKVMRKGGNDKRGITVTLSETITRKILPFQLIYTRKTACSPPSVEFPNGFCLSYNPKHWSNKDETINLLESVVERYFCQVREELGLQNDQKALILWDAF